MGLIRPRPAPGPRALARPRLRAFPEAPAHAGPALAGGVVELPGRDWPALGRAAWALLPGSAGRVLLDARMLSAAEAAELSLCLALAGPAGAVVDLWHPAAAALRPRLAEAVALRRGVALARSLAAMDAAVPRDIARRLRGLQRQGIAVQRLKRRRLRAAGFGGLLAASGAAAPRLVVMRWAGRIAAPPLVFAGLGVTGAGSAGMAGAAACAGALLSLALRDSPAPAAAVLALCAPGGDLPDQPVALLGGGTLAPAAARLPGQLALAEAMTYAALAFRPGALVGLGRLTEGAGAALGGPSGGAGAALFGSDPPLEAALAAAGAATGEPLWPLPPLAGDTPAAPGPGEAGRAAGFLGSVLGGQPWTLLDLASEGGALDSGAAGRHITGGFGVRLLDRLARQRFEDPHRL
ncbi:hypothetical protein BKE38_23975 [Pseudoroseomonas deserti]|uniref:Cytosol aminopeptidase domain-containing protein n=1 Tax=Teichococcus deserti TaxID=1817963 RepID=A0A1V2GWM6_9PROT|nr:hypothetical protein [Pseudoroseomonas deserti]ONG47316.1 hypothetical protein BKE38_23975 [Pseudoroseomonas deserti]